MADIPLQPRDEYNSHLARAEEDAAKEHKRHIATGNWRFAIFVIAAAVAYLGFARHLFNEFWLLAPLAVFFALAFVDDAVLRKFRAAQRRVAYYERGISRINEAWQTSGATGTRFASANDIYSHDLDLFTQGGLFQLLSVARTAPGESLLASWLLTPAAPHEITRRHKAIVELRTLLDFREALATTGDHVLAQEQADPLWKWSEIAPPLNAQIPRIAAACLSAAMMASILWYGSAELQFLAGEASHPPLVAFSALVFIAVATAIFGFSQRRTVANAIGEFERIRPGLALLADMLLVLERAKFSTVELQSIQSNVIADAAPSRQIARLNFFADMLDSRENVLLRVIGPPLLWTTQTCLAIDAWRARYRSVTRQWVEAVSQIEALSSLATYSYERPADCFPEIVSSTEFTAADLGHPLLPSCVNNSVSITAERPLLIVSGSNMSGKSTLLRAIGINAVLALAGAPVRARSLKLPVLSIATSIQVADSLQDGASHFSAEIERIRQIVDLARSQPPALFLIDELLQGTNSGDRRVGSEAILSQLLDLGAIGVITTHDLALTQIGRAKPGRVVNAHFKDQILGGKMVFDYVLKPGVVQGSNALDLMRLYGLI